MLIGEKEDSVNLEWQRGQSSLEVPCSEGGPATEKPLMSIIVNLLSIYFTWEGITLLVKNLVFLV